jgi:DNA-binding transcriptional MerR regulator
MKSYSIGEAARHSGVKVPTIRYYESIGLLPAPPRAHNDRRVFDHAALERLAFIRHARSMGFEINEISALLSLRDNPRQSCAKVDEIARARLADIEERIRQLETLRTELKTMIGNCSSERVSSCNIIGGLSERCCA